MSGKCILVVVTSHDRIDPDHPTGLWFEEFAIPYEAFRKAGFAVTVASPNGGRAPIDPRSAPNQDQAQMYGAAVAALCDTRALKGIDAGEYAAIFFPGGHGTMFDMPSEPVGRLVSQFADAGKVVAAVCHGPAAFVRAVRADGTPLVKGRKVTAFTNEEERAVELDRLMPFLLESRLRELGAEFVPAPRWSDHVVVDGRVITGQNPQSSASAARAVIAALSS